MNFPHPMRRHDDRPQRRLRRGVYLLPSLFTCANIAAGYYAIVQTSQASLAEPWRFDLAAKFIGLAVLFDSLDGFVARLTKTSSDFGRELDSLADVIAFGIAPALLAFIWGFHLLPAMSVPLVRHRLIHVGAIASFIFLVAGASRLARFNIQINPQPSNPGRPDRRYFVGMPIPAAAGMLASIIHLVDGQPPQTWWASSIWLALMAGLSFLMVSTWRFYSLKGINLAARRPHYLVVMVGAFLACIWYFSHIFLFCLASFYLLAAVIWRLQWIFRGKRNPPPPLREASQTS